MNMTMPIENNETYTYTSSRGVVIVITDVPALVYVDSSGNKEVRLKPKSSRVVNNYIRQALDFYTEPSVYPISFEDAKEGVSVDAQIRFIGENIGFYNSPLNVWRNTTFMLEKAYDFLKDAYMSIRDLKTVAYPTLSPSPGSLIFGLKAHHKPPLFEDSIDLDDLITDEIQILQLLIDSHAFINAETVENELILNYPQIQLAAVKAVERLAPQDKSAIHEVQIIPRSKLLSTNKISTFTSETHARAKSLKNKIQSDIQEDVYRDVVIVGQIDTLSRRGTMTIRDVEYSYPEYKNYATTANFTNKIWEDLTLFFKQKERLLFQGVEYQINGKWSSQPIIKQVKKAPAKNEVELAYSKKILLSNTISKN